MKKSIIAQILMTVLCIFSVNSYAADLEGINIHGFLSQGYVKTTENSLFTNTIDGTFEFNEFGINFSKELTDKLRLGIQFFAKDYGATGNDKIEVDWAYGDYRFKDWLGIRAGKLKARHGLYNETRDIDMLRTPIFLPQSVYPEILRETTLAITGGSIYGSFDLQGAGTLSYQMAYGAHNIEPSERAMQALMDTISDVDVIENDRIDVDSKYSFSLLWDTPLDGLRLSGTTEDTEFTARSHVAAEMGDMFTIGDTLTIPFKKLQHTVYSAEYTFSDLILATEYMVTNRDFHIGMDSGFDLGHQVIETKGWYVSSSYRFTDWFVLGSYYSKSESDTEGRGGGDVSDEGRLYQKDVCLTTRFDINEYMTFKLEGHSLKGTNGLSPKDNPEDVNGDRWTDSWNLFAAKVTFNF